MKSANLSRPGDALFSYWPPHALSLKFSDGKACGSQCLLRFALLGRAMHGEVNSVLNVTI
eukprot:scaffold5634_cov13-Prasinocladus_malaysianus.AAC.1